MKTLMHQMVYLIFTLSDHNDMEKGLLWCPNPLRILQRICSPDQCVFISNYRHQSVEVFDKSKHVVDKRYFGYRVIQ
jgi:hypothetical protein